MVGARSIAARNLVNCHRKSTVTVTPKAHLKTAAPYCVLAAPTPIGWTAATGGQVRRCFTTCFCSSFILEGHDCEAQQAKDAHIEIMSARVLMRSVSC
jgi:hypothetical protein